MVKMRLRGDYEDKGGKMVDSRLERVRAWGPSPHSLVGL